MATMERVKPQPQQLVDVDDEEDILRRVPTPFPLANLTPRTMSANGVARKEAKVDDNISRQEVDNDAVAGPSTQSLIEAVDTDMEASLQRVQHSCLSALTTLLIPGSGSTSQTHTLMGLLSTLRSLRASHGQMMQIGTSSDPPSLFAELNHYIPSYVSEPRDKELASSLIELLARLDTVSVLSTSLAHPSPGVLDVEEDVYTTLSRHVESFKSECTNSPQQTSLERILQWNGVELEMDNVLRLCQQPTSTSTNLHYDYTSPDHLPPGYVDSARDTDADTMSLPSYDHDDGEAVKPSAARASSSTEKPRSQTQTRLSIDSEKMRAELDNVAEAIERMYLIAPQMHDQRVDPELRIRSRNRAQSQSQSLTHTPRQSRTQTQTPEPDPEMLDLIAKSSSRRLSSQTFTPTNSSTRLEKEAQRKREFHEHLLDHTGSRRMEGQDAEWRERERVGGSEREKERDMEEMIDLPKFISEEVPVHSESKGKDGEGVATVKRSKSHSGWLRLREKDSEKDLATGGVRKTNGLEPVSASNSAVREWGPSLKPVQITNYVAEHHQSLSTVILLLSLSSTRDPPSTRYEARVPQHTPTCLILKNTSTHSNVNITLPMPVKWGPVPVSLSGTDGGTGSMGEVRMAVDVERCGENRSTVGEDKPPSLLSATQLTSLNPSALICSSCSLPIIRCSNLKYLDLPSEHWAELLDVWMCHPEQKLSEAVGRQARRGLWPRRGEALVGVGYLLVREAGEGTGGVVGSNLKEGDNIKGSDWHTVRCLCGGVIGRSQQVTRSDDEMADVFTCYRFAKYSVRLVSSGAEPVRLSLGAFFVEDMHAIAQAHANWRFVVADEEEGKPRFMIWLFKPSIGISWLTSAHRVIAASGTQLSAKVLFKTVDPNLGDEELQSMLGEIPGFYRAEWLSYPRDACRRLVALLKDTNRAYPEAMRQMTELDVGWLERGL